MVMKRKTKKKNNKKKERSTEDAGTAGTGGIHDRLMGSGPIRIVDQSETDAGHVLIEVRRVGQTQLALQLRLSQRFRALLLDVQLLLHPLQGVLPHHHQQTNQNNKSETIRQRSRNREKYASLQTEKVKIR